MNDKLPVVARLYYSGSASRRYKRASTRPGPGEPLSFTSVAEEWLRREKLKTNAIAAAAEKLLSAPENKEYQRYLRAVLELAV